MLRHITTFNKLKQYTSGITGISQMSSLFSLDGIFRKTCVYVFRIHKWLIRWNTLYLLRICNMLHFDLSHFCADTVFKSFNWIFLNFHVTFACFHKIWKERAFWKCPGDNSTITIIVMVLPVYITTYGAYYGSPHTPFFLRHLWPCQK